MVNDKVNGQTNKKSIKCFLIIIIIMVVICLHLEKFWIIVESTFFCIKALYFQYLNYSTALFLLSSFSSLSLQLSDVLTLSCSVCVLKGTVDLEREEGEECEENMGVFDDSSSSPSGTLRNYPLTCKVLYSYKVQKGCCTYQMSASTCLTTTRSQCCI